MNNFKLIIILFLISILNTRCEQSVSRTYVIENSTTHTLEIKFFQDNQTEKIILLRGEESWQIYYEEQLASNTDAYFALKADSCVIIFDDIKIKHYALSVTSDRNILFNESYLIENDELYRYIFTEEDYENADEIVQ